MTERRERLLLTLYHRGKPNRWPGKPTLDALAGYVIAEGENLALTDLGREYCRAVLEGEPPPPPPASAPAQPEDQEQAIVEELVRFNGVRGHWPTAWELTRFQRHHQSGVRRQLRRGVETGSVEICATDGPRGGARYRPAEAA